MEATFWPEVELGALVWAREQQTTAVVVMVLLCTRGRPVDGPPLRQPHMAAYGLRGLSPSPFGGVAVCLFAMSYSLQVEGGEAARDLARGVGFLPGTCLYSHLPACCRTLYCPLKYQVSAHTYAQNSTKA